jgi:hypothetical protein
MIQSYESTPTEIEKFLNNTKGPSPKFLNVPPLTEYDKTSISIINRIKDIPEFQYKPAKKTVSHEEFVTNVRERYRKEEPSGSSSITTEIPSGYIRTPLTISPIFLDYLNRKTKPNPILLPGNPETFWNEPITQEILNEAQTDKELQKAIFSQNIQNIALSSFPIGLAFGIKANNITPLTKQKQQQQKRVEDSDDDDNDLFTVKSSQKKQQKDYGQTVGSFFSTGFPDSKPLGVKHDRSDPILLKSTRSSSKIDATTFKRIYSEEFPGPWESNMKFYDEISSNAVALFFLSIILSEFTIEPFENLAKIGQKLINLDFIRCSEEHEMSTCIVMKMGAETMVMVFGRTIVIPSVDGISGAITVSAEFHLGYVRNNPKKIDWLPYCSPNSFIGGQNNGFMRTVDQFYLPNTAGGPSILVVPKPVSETGMDSPVNLLNDDTYEAPNNLMTSTIYRKYSSSKFIQHVLGSKKLEYASAEVKTRTNYYQHQRHSFVLFQGALRYPNCKGVFDKITPGIGPKGYVEMNTGNAYRAWNGDGKFSAYVPDKLEYW